MTEISRAWPFQEAQKLLERFAAQSPESGAVLFETGYGPSGLPHLGTFGEVARTAMVRHAFTQLSDLPTRLVCFSDDMDGMRKIPDNVPNADMLAEHLGKPLTAVPDPFGTHASFGEHNNARLRSFLDGFGFDYEFLSATECYRGGRFDAALGTALRRNDAIMDVMLPTLGPERRQSYSPFLPISPKTGQILYVPTKKVDAVAGTITFDDEDGEETTLPVTGGHCKLQWKPDFGMRWAALGVDFEMYGKDHLVNGKIYSAICTILGGEPPEQFNYELFLDEKGEKISKSKGNGVAIEEWLRYGPQESLALYMFQSPKKAKRLHFDVIPKAVDEYLTFLQKFPEQDDSARKENPVWHIHHGNPPKPEAPVGFGLLLNLAGVCNPENKDVLWAYISQYAPGVTPESAPLLDRLTDHAVRYYHDFVKTAKAYREPTTTECEALFDLAGRLKHLDPSSDGEAIQTMVYEVGMTHGFEPLRAWFSCLYEVLLGQSQGPRMGSFFALYGVENSVRLIEDALAGRLTAA